jgi:hypothetical protein
VGPLHHAEVTAPVGPDEEYTPAGIPTGGVGGANPPGPDVTPEPGARPDTSLSWWYVPYLNAERDKPTTVQTINGITVGPGRLGVRENERERCQAETRTGTFDEVQEPEMAIVLDAFPPGSKVISSGFEWAAIFCAERTLAAGADVSVPADRENGVLGGSVIIAKYRGAPVSSLSIPDDRWRAAEIDGYPAAIAEPILPEIGLGESAVIVYYAGILLRVQGHWVPLDMLIAIAAAQIP